jgi:hypothetical protein
MYKFFQMAFNKFNRGRGKTQAIVFGIITLIVVLIIVLLFRGSTYEGMNTTTPARPTQSPGTFTSNTGGKLLLKTGRPECIRPQTNLILPSNFTNFSTFSYAMYSDALIEPNTGGALLYDKDYLPESSDHKSKLANLSGLTITSVTFTPTVTEKPVRNITSKPGSVNGGDLRIVSGARSVIYTLVTPSDLPADRQPSVDSYRVIDPITNESIGNAHSDMQAYFVLKQGQTALQ